MPPALRAFRSRVLDAAKGGEVTVADAFEVDAWPQIILNLFVFSLRIYISNTFLLVYIY